MLAFNESQISLNNTVLAHFIEVSLPIGISGIFLYVPYPMVHYFNRAFNFVIGNSYFATHVHINITLRDLALYLWQQ